METSIKEKSITSVTVSGSDFRDLIAGALTHASKDETLARLCGVYLGREEGRVIAIATDRYRLIEGKIESEGEGESKPIRLAYGDAKALSSALSKVKREKVTLTLAGDIVSVTVAGSTYTYTAHLDDLPPYRHLMEVSGDPVAFPYLSLNPSFFADYGKICGKRAQVVVRQYGGDKPYHIEIFDTDIEWRAMLMPMRVKE
jgi:hypothetical protein